MSTRYMEHPTFEVEEHDDGFLVRFRVAGSNLGPVEVVLSPTEADELSGSLDQAQVFAGTADEEVTL